MVKKKILLYHDVHKMNITERYSRALLTEGDVKQGGWINKWITIWATPKNLNSGRFHI